MDKVSGGGAKVGAVDGEAGYCVCNEPATPPNTMVSCGMCNKWYHIKCVLQDADTSLISKYICDDCQTKTGSKTKWIGKGKKKRKQDETHMESDGKKEEKSPKKAKEDPDSQNYFPKKPIKSSPATEPVRRSARAKVKHNYSELNDGAEQEGADKSVTIDYVKMLKKANCVKSNDIPHKMRGEDLTMAFLSENGFREPLLVDGMEALDMKMPPSSITINRIKELVGSTRLVDVIEVPTQAEVDPKWSMEQWAEYYHTPIEKRTRILNVISLEISKTPLCAQIRTPKIVREIDWIDKVWPHRWKASSKYPQVQVYCLMSVQNSYTDFHIDFGGSSVWYHVIKGKKVFYLIPPTKDNLEKYATWSSSPRQNKVWFGNLVDKCYEAHVDPGQTFFIPTGWIHAVFTPEDSLVFGGNFLHGLNCRLQLEVYDIEQATHVPDKFRFPLFRQIIWFAAIYYVDTIKEKGVDFLDKWELDSARAIMDTLDIWLMDSIRAQRDIPPKVRNPELVLDDLHRLLDNESAESAQAKKRERDLKLMISKEDLIKAGGEDVFRDVENDGQRSVEQKPKKGYVKTGKPRGPKRKKTTPSSSPSPSSTPSSASPPTPSSTSPSSPYDDPPRFQHPIKPDPSPRISSPLSSSFPFAKQYNNGYPSPSPSSLSYNTAPYSHVYNHDPYPPKNSSSFSPYPSPASSSSYPSHYKVYNPPTTPARHSSSSPSPRAQFSDLLHLTNAAESIENESSPYKPYNSYESSEYASPSPSRSKYYENTKYYENAKYNESTKYYENGKYSENGNYYENSNPRYTSYVNGTTLTFVNSKPPPPSYPPSDSYRTSDPYRSSPYYAHPDTSIYKDTSNGYKYPADHEFRNAEPLKRKGSLSFILNSRDSDEEYPSRVVPPLPPLSNY